MKLRQSSVVSAAAAVVVVLLEGVAGATTTGPLINVNILGTTSATNASNGVYSSNVPVSANQTVYFEVTAQLAPIGTTQHSNTINTLTAHPTATTTGYDGLDSFSFNLSDAGSFAGAFQQNSLTLSTSPDNWANLGSSPGTANGATVSAVRDQDNAGVYAGATSPTVLLTGSFVTNSTVGGISTVGGAFGSVSSTFQINTNPSTGLTGTKITIGANDVNHYSGFTGLSLNGGALNWDGATNANWSTLTSDTNFSSLNYTDGSTVSFGDYATNGTTAVKNTNPITIATGGVLPASVTFNNGAANTYRFTTAGTVGIGGSATTVAVNGPGNVIFASPNTYAGATTISGGTLRANNGSSGSATGTSNITLSGGALGGNGTVTGTVTVNSGGTITAGQDAVTPGKLTTGAQAWNGGGTYLAKITDATGTEGNADGNDELSLGSLTVGATNQSQFKVTLQSFTIGSPDTAGAVSHFSPTSSYTWKIAEINGTTLNSSTSVPAVLATTNADGTPAVSSTAFALDTSDFANRNSAVGTFALEAIDNGSSDTLEVLYTYNSTPEPGACMLLLIGSVPTILGRRRRKSIVA